MGSLKKFDVGVVQGKPDDGFEIYYRDADNWIAVRSDGDVVAGPIDGFVDAFNKIYNESDFVHTVIVNDENRTVRNSTDTENEIKFNEELRKAQNLDKEVASGITKNIGDEINEVDAKKNPWYHFFAIEIKVMVGSDFLDGIDPVNEIDERASQIAFANQIEKSLKEGYPDATVIVGINADFSQTVIVGTKADYSHTQEDCKRLINDIFCSYSWVVKKQDA